MTSIASVTDELTLRIEKEIKIAAPPSVAFEALLEQLGEGHVTPEGPMAMKLEAWPGGRWYRDLGDNNGHLWGHVQVLKRSELLEITGPMFMSYAAVSHIQWRVEERSNGSVIKLRHLALGVIAPEHREGVNEGWKNQLEKTKKLAEAK